MKAVRHEKALTLSQRQTHREVNKSSLDVAAIKLSQAEALCKHAPNKASWFHLAGIVLILISSRSYLFSHQLSRKGCTWEVGPGICVIRMYPTH